MFTTSTCILLTTYQTCSICHKPKLLQTLHFALVGAFRHSVELPILLLVLLLTDSVSQICFSIITLNIEIVACTYMCNYRYKNFYIGIMIVSFISIYWYIDIYRPSLPVTLLSYKLMLYLPCGASYYVSCNNTTE